MTTLIAPLILIGLVLVLGAVLIVVAGKIERADKGR